MSCPHHPQYPGVTQKEAWAWGLAVSVVSNRLENSEPRLLDTCRMINARLPKVIYDLLSCVNLRALVQGGCED